MVGVGNRMRGDDAAGLEVARRLASCELPSGVAVKELEGEALALLELWSGAEAVILVDTVRSGGDAGTVHRIDASSEPLPAQLQHTSSHTVSVADAIELARGLGKLPDRVIVFGIEGRDFKAGAPLGDAVRSAAERATDAVRREAIALSDGAAGQGS